MTTTSKTTATSIHQSLEVVIDDAGLVRATNGALLGDVEGMTRLGWEFTTTEPTVAPATFERIAREILRANGAGKDPRPELLADTIRELEHQHETTGALPTAHQSRLQATVGGLEFWACSCGRTGTPTSRSIAGDRQAKHVDAARRPERAQRELDLEIHRGRVCGDHDRPIPCLECQ